MPTPTEPSSGAAVAPPPRHVFRRLLLVGLGFGPGFVLGDLLAGYAAPTQDLREEGAVVVDEELGWTNAPGEPYGAGRISSIGLRGEELPDAPPPDELRVLGLGASRIFGIGVDRPEDLWSAALGERLDEGGGRPWRVLNAGVKAYSLLQSSRLGVRLLPVVDPDLVLLFVDPGAQALIDASSASEWVQVGGTTVPRDVLDAAPAWLHPVVVPLHKALLRSNLYTRYRAQFVAGGGRPESLKRFVVHAGPWPDGADRYVGAALAGAEDLSRACAERGVRLRVVVLPFPTATNGWSWRRYLQLNQDEGAPPPGTPRGEGVRLLAAELRRRGLEVWDLTPELDEIGADLDRFTTDERHWSAEGHAVVGRGLHRRIADEPRLVDALAEARRARPRR